MDDKWELLVLSCFARADPEMAAAAPGVEAEARGDFRGGRGGDFVRRRRGRHRRRRRRGRRRGAPPESSTPAARRIVGSSPDEMLQHLLALEGGRKLFDAALGTYDLALAYLVGKASPEMSPDDFVPELERLEAMPDALRRSRRGRAPRPVRVRGGELRRGGQSAGAIAVAKARRLFPLALSKATELAEATKANAVRLKAFAADVAADVAAGVLPRRRRRRLRLRPRPATAGLGGFLHARRHRGRVRGPVVVGEQARGRRGDPSERRRGARRDARVRACARAPSRARFGGSLGRFRRRARAARGGARGGASS